MWVQVDDEGLWGDFGVSRRHYVFEGLVAKI